MEFKMTAQPALTLAVQLEDVGNVSSVRESSDRVTLNALFKLIEMAEPTLLLCRDALAETSGHAGELSAIQASLDHIGELKSTVGERIRSTRIFNFPS
jgi:hypothetical protein